MPQAGPDTDLLSWGVPRLRSLPWRDVRDPWAILVSEVMLQQTQTLRVIPKWLAFLEAFPDPAACAGAPLGDVLRLWQGLGYPRRARNLHTTARTITAELGGRFPDTLDGLLALPGVGAYTARAVLAFAFECGRGDRRHERGAGARAGLRSSAHAEAGAAPRRLVVAAG